MPLHQRILEDIEGRIISGEWPPGTKLPNETDLAERWACARMTVNKALTRLAERGLIERRKRSGTTVRGPVTQSAVLEIRDIRAEVEATGRPYRYQRLARLVRNANLDRPDPSSALHPRRRSWRSSASTMPAMNRSAWRSGRSTSRRCPKPATRAFTDVAPGPWLTALVPWSSAEHTIEAVAADKNSAPRLGLRIGTPCLVIDRRTMAAGVTITHVRLTYPGHRYSLVAHFEPSQARDSEHGRSVLAVDARDSINEVTSRRSVPTWVSRAGRRDR